MKIGIDCRLWDQTGVGRYTRNLVINLQKIDRKNDYVLFVRKEDEENLKSQISNLKCRLVRADIKWHSIEEQIIFPSILNKENLDLVHFPYFSVPYFYNRPYVVTIHDLIINHFPTGKASTKLLPLYLLKLSAYKYLIKTISQKSKKIIAPSFATKIEIMEHLKIPEKKIVVTYEGADTKISNLPPSLKFRRAGKSQISNKPQNTKYKILNTKYYLYVGNAYPHKNLENLLIAFVDYEKNRGEGKLMLVGKIDYFYERLKERVEELNLKSDVLFLGKVSDKELTNLYQNAIGLILPSKMEGFGLPVLEAMSNKCLILASDIPSIREIADDNALYFNPSDTNEITEALKKAQNAKKDKNTEEMIERNYKRSLEFSWKEMAKETLSVYENAVQSL